ncbi:type IIL restriction-modification enzyme MmeI [Brevibacterium ravenspurgense]|uniref:type IIL restriction-modification enzyme MmeI n=1 Tax=Brevibacterium ravenspurgense TaxID=479117 RepID=UPI002F91A881
MPRSTIHFSTTEVHFEVKTYRSGYIDMHVPTAKTLVEQKSRGVDLDKAEPRQGRMVTPFEQAKQYADAMPNDKRPDKIVVCNFDTFRIHSLTEEGDPSKNYTEFQLDELAEQYHLLDFFTDAERMRRVREEKVSLDAGNLIGELYDMLRQQYLDPDSEASQHSLNVLCVRLVFCLFAEDAAVFPRDVFKTYLLGLSARQVRPALKELFVYLDTPPGERDPYASDELKAFPYVNGGLFADRTTEIPQFTDEMADFLINEVSASTNWAEISPTIFGGVFESTLNPETRRAGGMHYTSPANIHKIIDPLFLDDLKAELETILADMSVTPRTRTARLQRFHDKIASLTFFERKTSDLIRPAAAA